MDTGLPSTLYTLAQKKCIVETDVLEIEIVEVTSIEYATDTDVELVQSLCGAKSRCATSP